MRDLIRRGLAVGIAAGAWLALAGIAQANVIHVHPGQSIQAAVNAANPGDTIKVAAGVYHDNVTITDSHITLVGAGSGRHGTILRPRVHPRQSPCNDTGSGGQIVSVNGICAVGSFDQTGAPAAPIVGTRISGLRVVGFSSTGIILFNAEHSTIAGNSAIGNTEYGMAGFLQHGIVFRGNHAAGGDEAGFYVGDSPDARAVMTRNTAVGAEFGFFFRDSEHGSITKNRSHGNCVGVMALDTGEPGADGFVRIAHNRVFHNRKACPAAEGPPLSGVGILLLGTTHGHVSGNRVTRNRPSGPTFTSGGIVLLSASAVGGAAPTNDVITGNFIHRNRTKDLRYDGSGSGNVLTGNDCGTSSPAGLC